MNVIRILENVPRWKSFISMISLRRISGNAVIKYHKETCAIHRQTLAKEQHLSKLAFLQQSSRHFSSSKTLLSLEAPSDKYLVYKGSLTYAVHVTKFISLSSSMFGLAIQPYLISQMSGAHLAIIASVGSMVCFFTYVTPLLIHWITKRYVVYLHYIPETGTFTCTTLSFFLTRKLMEFKASDLVMPDVPGVFTSFLVKGKPLLLDPAGFLDIEAYRHMMGYDKPIDLKLGNQDDKQS